MEIAVGFGRPVIMLRFGSQNLSVEWSDGYSSFRPGYYIVIAASAYPDTGDLGVLLAKVKRVYPDAYIKEGLVYHGCMH